MLCKEPKEKLMKFEIAIEIESCFKILVLPRKHNSFIFLKNFNCLDINQ